MLITVADQTYIFMYCIICGALLGIAFDIFRIIRLSVPTSDFATFIQDIIYWIISAVIVFAFMLKINSGEFRWYMLAGVFLGIIMYIITVSVYIVISITFLVNIIKKTISSIFMFIMKPILYIIRIVSKPFIIVINLSKRSLHSVNTRISYNISIFTKIIKKI